MKKARDMLRAFHRGDTESFLQSAVYRTKPQDCPEGSPDFYNAVIEMEWKDEDEDGGGLLELMGEIEYFFGREVRVIRNSPRPMDLDILYLGDVVLETDRLTLPHPRIGKRAFVLQPLVDILGDAPIPGLGKSAVELLAQLNADPEDLTFVTNEW